MQDSTYKYYEVILVDTEHKVIREVRQSRKSLLCILLPGTHVMHWRVTSAAE